MFNLFGNEIPGENGWGASVAPGEGDPSKWPDWLRLQLTGSTDKAPGTAAGLKGLGAVLQPPKAPQQQAAAAPASPAPPGPPPINTQAAMANLQVPGAGARSPFSAAPDPRRRRGSIYGAESSSPFTPA